MTTTLDVLFDGPPGNSSGRFVEVEIDGRSVSAGNGDRIVSGEAVGAAGVTMETLTLRARAFEVEDYGAPNIEWLMAAADATSVEQKP